MNFLIYNEAGEIVQSNKLYAWKKEHGNGRTQDHTSLLNDLGQKFTMVDSPSPLDPAKYFVNSRRQARVRPTMPIELHSTTVKVGPSDAIRMTGIPVGAKMIIRARSFKEPLHTTEITDGSLECELPAPGLYTVTLSKFPYVEYSVDIEGVA